MKNLLPKSIAGRTVLVLLVGLTISHVLSVAMYYSDRTDALALVGGGQIAERIASITRLIDSGSPVERTRVLKAVNSSTLRVSLASESSVKKDAPKGWRAGLIRRVLKYHLGPLEDQRIRVDYVEPSAGADFANISSSLSLMAGREEAMRSHMQRMAADLALGRGLSVSIRLSDNNWLNFAAPDTQPELFWSFRFILSMLVMVSAVAVFSLWAARRLTNPIAVIARAAERLGTDVSAPALPESGPREVRQVTRAFNEMQRRIRRFVEDRTQMIAAISHDLRTPITRLRLRAEFVEDKEQHDKMLADLDEMEAMISSTLSFARDEAAAEKREVVDLIALVQSACDDLEDAGHSVEFHGEGRLPLTCRRIALRRALNNLLDNAVKYGGRARVALLQEAGTIAIQIDDDGPGIPESELEKAFAPFYRVERSRSRDTGGVGLGLAFARSVIRAHGGDIRLINRDEGGLRVIVTLPHSQ